ncbi:MAG: radical SAM protein [Treponema sp.]|nr:radical SAM protein [Spirochaetales bacterium]MDY5811181.1 radical SAM protein [Treponema sp.]
MKETDPGFMPEEIIFCPTSLCNLKCAHCFVEQKNARLNIEDSIALLKDCAQNIDCLKVGFSGGEPFLNLDFTKALCQKALDLDLVFDRLMTNGVWWNTEKELEEKLAIIRDSGFDGKIGLSFDKFHNQDIEKVITFINACFAIFNDRNTVEILSVADAENIKADTETFCSYMEEIKNKTGFTNITASLNKKNGTGSIILTDDDCNALTVYRFAQSFIPHNPIELKDKNWFTEDYCQATGNVFYVHADGNIAPCCGFANERPELFIGTVKDSFKTLMQNAENNAMVNLCYKKGLSAKAKELQKQKKLSQGKCSDMCQLCWWFCTHNK